MPLIFDRFTSRRYSVFQKSQPTVDLFLPGPFIPSHQISLLDRSKYRISTTFLFRVKAYFSAEHVPQYFRNRGVSLRHIYTTRPVRGLRHSSDRQIHIESIMGIEFYITARAGSATVSSTSKTT